MLRFLVLGLVLAAGCTLEADGKDEPAPVCEAGKVEACPCADAEPATQTCKSDGSGWGACGCSMLTPEQRDPDVSCQSEQDPSQFDRACPPGKRMFIRCEQVIAQSGVCYYDTVVAMYCCSDG